MICYHNGDWMDENAVRLSPWDRGLLLGDGLFETLGVSGGRPEFLVEHLERFFADADSLQLALPVSRAALQSALRQLPQRAGIASGRLRINLTRGIPDGEELGRPGSWDDAWRPTLLMLIRPATRMPHPPPMRLWLSPRPIASSMPSAGRKTLSYIDHLHARHLAQQRRADDALLVNEHGAITETGFSNIAWIVRGELHTPAEWCGCLPGIIRRVVLRIAKEAGIPARQVAARPDVLHEADGGVFTMNSTQHLAPVAALDGKDLPTCGNLFARLQTAVAAEAARSAA